MGRKVIGPRKLHGPSGIYYAVFIRADGKTFRESLKTRDHLKAIKRWPSAFQRCRERASEAEGGWTPDQAIKARAEYKDSLGADGEYHPQLMAAEMTGKKEQDIWTGEMTDKTTEELAGFIAGFNEMPLSWDAAFEIHNTRIAAKRGRPISEKTKVSQELARRGITTSPMSFNIADVQQYVRKLEDQKLSANTISQRHGMMRAVVGSLIKRGHMTVNMWDRVDCTAAKGGSHKTPTQEEVKALWDQGDWFIRMYLYTGLREKELTSRYQSHVDGKWLVINEYDKPVKFRLKNKNSIRDLMMPDWCGDVLPTQREMPKSTTTWRKVKRIAPECNLHSLRHAFREALRVAQVPTELAERVLGHAHKGQVGTYGSFSREAVEPAMRGAWKVIDRWVGKGD